MDYIKKLHETVEILETLLAQLSQLSQESHAFFYSRHKPTQCLWIEERAHPNTFNQAVLELVYEDSERDC